MGSHDFEIEDFHTYFVGEAGVWVHNHGLSCDLSFSRWKELTKNGISDPLGSYLEHHKLATSRKFRTSTFGQNKNYSGIIDDMLERADELPLNVQRLAEEGGSLSRKGMKEAFAALMFEKKRGVGLTRSNNPAYDFDGPVGFDGPFGSRWDAVGPTEFVSQDGKIITGQIDDLIRSIQEDHFDNPAKGNPVILLTGLGENFQKKIIKAVERMPKHGKSFEILTE